MNDTPDVDAIDELLGRQDADMEDGGFTARVVQRLPRQRRSWRGPALVLSAAAIGSVLAVVWVPWGNLPPLDPTELLWANAQILLPWSLALAVSGSLIWSATAAALRL